MLDSLGEYFPEAVSYTRPEGGLFVWAQLPEGLEAEPLFRRSVQECKVAFIPGEHFFVDGTGKNTMRLNFSSEPVEKIRQGMQKLGTLISQSL